jgi:uncharacterized phiE125 gp8 family phage protein
MTFKVAEEFYTLPFTLAVGKSHLRYMATAEDAVISRNIRAATIYAENRMWRKVTHARLIAIADKFPDNDGFIELPRPPFISLISVQYRTKGGAYQTLDPSQYVVDNVSEPCRIAPVGSWPFADGVAGVRIEYTAGYVDPVDIPEDIISGIQMMMAHLFENREAVVVKEGGVTIQEVPMSANRLFDMNSTRTA